MTDRLVRQATVVETGESTFSVAVRVSGFEVTGDEPTDAGGGNLGPAPYDFLIAALGTCTVMTVRWYARRQAWPLERAEAVITHEKRDGKDHFTKRLRIEGSGLTDEQRAKLLDAAAKCPVHRTLTSEVTIEAGWRE